MRFELRFPEGWEIQNTPSQVAAKEPGEEAFLLLQLASRRPARSRTLRVGGMRNAGLRRLRGAAAPSTDSRPMSALTRATSEGSAGDRAGGAHRSRAQDVHLRGPRPRGRLRSRGAIGRTSIRSFGRSSREEAARIRPNRIDLYTVARRATRGSRSPGVRAKATCKRDDARHHEQLRRQQQPRPGDRIKIVVSAGSAHNHAAVRRVGRAAAASRPPPSAPRVYLV